MCSRSKCVQSICQIMLGNHGVTVNYHFKTRCNLTHIAAMMLGYNHVSAVSRLSYFHCFLSCVLETIALAQTVIYHIAIVDFVKNHIRTTFCVLHCCHGTSGREGIGSYITFNSLDNIT